MSYRPRIIDDQLRALLARCPAVLLDGARGIGKSTTGGEHAATVYDMEDPQTRQDLQERHLQMMSAERPIFIDEWLRYPQSMNLVKLAVDRDRSPGQFIMAGTPSTPRDTSVHTGGMRVVDLEMRPMSLAERGLCVPSVSLRGLLAGDRDAVGGSCEVTKSDYAREIVRSGFPALVFERHEPAVLEAYLEGYIARLPAVDMRYVEQRRRRFPIGPVRDWLTAYARETSRMSSYATMRDNAHIDEGDPPARQTAANYRRLMTELGVIDPLRAWQCPVQLNPKPVRRSMHHLVDPALAAHLLEVAALPRLLDMDHAASRQPDYAFGAQLFQSLVTQSVRTYARANNAKTRWLRTQRDGRGGEREIDIIVADPDSRAIAIEVKFGATVNADTVKHLKWLRNELGNLWIDGIVINTGTTAYRRNDGIAVIPAALLGP